VKNRRLRQRKIGKLHLMPRSVRDRFNVLSGVSMRLQLSKYIGGLFFLAFAGFAHGALLAPGSHDAESSAVIGSFHGYGGELLADVFDTDWQIDDAGYIAAGATNRSPAHFGRHVNFNFGEHLKTGRGSLHLFIDGGDGNHARNAIYEIARFRYSNLWEFFGWYRPIKPAANVPEPAPVVLLALALVALAWTARRKPVRAKAR
jgi:hypothetical protein